MTKRTKLTLKQQFFEEYADCTPNELLVSFIESEDIMTRILLEELFKDKLKYARDRLKSD